MLLGFIVQMMQPTYAKLRSGREVELRRLELNIQGCW